MRRSADYAFAEPEPELPFWTALTVGVLMGLVGGFVIGMAAFALFGGWR